MVTFKWDDKRALEIAREEGREEGATEGAKRVRYQMALNMLKEKAPINFIAKISELSIEQIRELAKEHHLVTE